MVSVPEDVADLRERMAHIEARLQAHERSTDQRLEAIAGQVAGVLASVGALNERLTSLTIRLALLTGGASALGGIGSQLFGLVWPT